MNAYSPPLPRSGHASPHEPLRWRWKRSAALEAEPSTVSRRRVPPGPAPVPRLRRMGSVLLQWVPLVWDSVEESMPVRQV